MSDDNAITVNASEHGQLLALVTAVAPKTRVRLIFDFAAEEVLDLLQHGWSGPPTLTIRQCVVFIGGSMSWWRAACLAGMVPGAKKRVAKNLARAEWLVPNAAAREVFAAAYATGGTGTEDAAGKVPPRSGSGVRLTRPAAHERKRRGPRGKQAPFSVVRGGQT